MLVFKEGGGMPCAYGVCLDIVDYTRDCWRLAAAAAKVSASRRSTREALDADERVLEGWLRAVTLHGYTSVLEHCKYTFEVVCSRVCSHQLVRHRVASYTQVSQRRAEWPVAEVARRLTGVEPRDGESWGRVAVGLEPLIEALVGYDRTGDDGYCEPWVGEGCEKLLRGRVLPALEAGFVRPPRVDTLAWAIATLEALYAYASARSDGVPPEDARYHLPQSVKTRVLVTMNARELLEVFFPLRLCARAQWEVRTVAWLLLQELRRVEPVLWRWAGPRCLRVAQLAGAECTLDDLVHGRCRLPVERCPEGTPAGEIPRCVRRSTPVGPWNERGEA